MYDKQLDDYYITMAELHAPTTADEVLNSSHELLVDGTAGWWVYRDFVCENDWPTRGRAAYAYLEHYKVLDNGR